MAFREKVIKYWWVFAGLIALILFIVFFTNCGSTPQGGLLESEWDKEFRHAADGVGIPKRDINLQFQYTTPKGANVRSTVALPADSLNAADEGISNMMAAHQAEPQLSAWTRGRSHSEYTITVIEPSINPHDNVSCAVESPDYKGAPCLYVQGFKTAGTVLGVGTELWDEIDKRPALVVPHQQNQNWQFRTWFRNSIHAEAEHYNEWLNLRNPPEGMFFRFVGGNDSHPHFGSFPADVAQLVNTKTKFQCVIPIVEPK